MLALWTKNWLHMLCDRKHFILYRDSTLNFKSTCGLLVSILGSFWLSHPHRMDWSSPFITILLIFLVFVFRWTCRVCMDALHISVYIWKKKRFGQPRKMDYQQPLTILYIHFSYLFTPKDENNWKHLELITNNLYT